MDGKVRTPQQKRSIEKKERILEMAIALFSESGFHSVNTKGIAKAAGVSTGAFYAYYLDKKAVLLDAIRLYHRRFDEIVEDRTALIVKYYDDKKTIISGLIMSIIEVHELYGTFHEMVRGLSTTDEEIKELVAKHDAKNDERARALIAIANPELTEEELVAAAVVLSAAIQGAVDRIFAMKEHRRALIEAAVELVHRFVFRRW